jgi:hypothetical protein
LAGTDGCTDDDVRRLEQVAGPYLLDTSEHDPPVYRLYHQALAYHLRAQYPDAVVAQQRITQTLLGLVPRDARTATGTGRLRTPTFRLTWPRMLRRPNSMTPLPTAKTAFAPLAWI